MSFGGGSTVQQQSLPPWLENAAQENLSRARYVSQLGYVPDYGMDVAAFSPMQQSAMQNSANAAAAFGLQAPMDAMAGMPKAQTNNLGFSGYSSGDLFDNSMRQFQQRRPAQYDAINSMFIDPRSGSVPDVLFTSSGSFANENAPSAAQGLVDYGPSGSAGSGDGVMNPRDWNTLSPEAQKAFMTFVPPFGLLTGVTKGVEAIKKKAWESREDKRTAAIRAKDKKRKVKPTSNGGSDSSSQSNRTSAASRSSTALGGTGSKGSRSNVGSRGGNASRGFSSGGW